MKVSTKIMGLVFIIIILLLTIDGYFSIQREIDLFDSDMKQDAKLLGNMMRDMFVSVWKRSGCNQAIQFIQDVSGKKDHIKIYFIQIPITKNLNKNNDNTLSVTTSISTKKAAENGIEQLFTYIPVKIENENQGVLVLIESLSSRNAYIRETMIRTIILAGIMLLASGYILWIVGTKFVGKPLKQLVEKTERIGESGDLLADLVIYGHDELSDLTFAMNRMCEQLNEARKTAHQETEKRIAAIEQLRHADRLATLGRLASGIAHELGTPLNVVAGRAKMIAKEQLEKKEIVEFATIIVAQTSRMTKIIRQLLDFARRRAIQRVPVNIINLTNLVIEMLRPIAKNNNVMIQIEKAEQLETVIMDQAQIQQVMTNLIMNGIQAMPGGGVLAIKIDVEHAAPPTGEQTEPKKYLTICVKDEGEGISGENIHHIFEPFFTTKGIGKGTGLGLSIAHGIVEEHGGWIDVQSEPDRGACFTVYLPMEVTE